MTLTKQEAIAVKTALEIINRRLQEEEPSLAGVSTSAPSKGKNVRKPIPQEKINQTINRRAKHYGQ